MPIYEYKCKKCGTVFEELFSAVSGKPLPCPKCRSEDTSKLMSVAGVGTGLRSEPSCAATCPTPNSCCGGNTCPMH